MPNDMAVLWLLDMVGRWVFKVVWAEVASVVEEVAGESSDGTVVIKEEAGGGGRIVEEEETREGRGMDVAGKYGGEGMGAGVIVLADEGGGRMVVGGA